MNEFRISCDKHPFTSRPNNSDVACISVRIANQAHSINQNNIKSFVKSVAEEGYTFCSATFKNGKSNKENFDQLQLLTLDFDDGISFEEVKKRADRYDLPILFAYDTFSSINHNKFRVAFLNDVSVTNIKVAELMLKALVTIFPEVDGQSKSPVQLYFGSNKGILYFDDSLQEINVELLLRNTTIYLEDRYGKHYKKHVERFSKDTGIALNKKKLLDISAVDKIAEEADAINGKNLPNPTIIEIPFGRKFPNRFCRINFGGCRTSLLGENKNPNYHRLFRASDLGAISSSCQLFREFVSGSRRLGHNELFCLATNLIYVETGTTLFKDTLKKYSYYDDEPYKYQKWNKDLRCIEGYKPSSCNGFCPHCDSCIHGMNILSTSKPKYHQIERLSNSIEQYVSIEEAEKDFKQKLENAMNAKENKWYVIKAQTSIGKTEAYLQLVKNTSQRILIAVPTNILKRDIRKRAEAMGIEIIESPSLHEIKNDLPDEVWGIIDNLLKSGRSVLPFLKKAIKEDDPRYSALCKKYKEELDNFNNCNSHAITTHKRLLTMDVSKYDLVIIDEDIIFNSIIPNKTDISFSDLKRLKKKIAPGSAILKKVNQVIKQSKENAFFTLDTIKYDIASGGKPIGVDVPALCSAKYFCYRKASDEENNLSEDCISFLTPVQFKPVTKYIMVSATVNETICQYYFGKDNIEFCECKKAKYRGILNQYYDRSMSRADINKDTAVISQIKKWSGFTHTISFKKYQMGDLHFGNTAGCDHLKGENIDVIGTPHQPDWIYKLFAYSVRIDFDEDVKIKPNIKVDYNGFRFLFTTFDEKALRDIQFYMIESELEQAVGRARLLRCDCTVNLFSNFPLSQAIMKESEYVKDDEEIEILEMQSA